jgi:hypothetical protein
MSNWTVLDKKNTAKVIKAVKNSGEPCLFNEETSEVKFRKLSFYKDISLYRITNYASLPAFTFDYLGDGHRMFFLDGTFEPLFGFNSSDSFNITQDNVLEYIEFYFDHVSDNEGEIRIIKSIQNHAGLDSLPPSELSDISSRDWDSKISFNSEDKSFSVSTIIEHVGSLVRAKINIDTSGRVNIMDYQLLKLTESFPETASL